MKKLIFAGVVVVVLLGGYLGVDAFLAPETSLPTAVAQKGEFLLSLRASGEVDARRAHALSAPRIKGLTITWLAPEGSAVKAGDPVIKFDQTQQIADLNDHQSTLKISQTSLERARKELTIQEKQLALDLQKAERNYDEKKHEAPKIAEEARLELELARLNNNAKLEQVRSDVQKAEFEVKRAEDKVMLAQKELNQATVLAPIPGMVVYMEIWKGGRMGKVQEGDSPWPGQNLVNLPDLSEMIVKAAVSEVDAAKIDSGQEVIIRLDAAGAKEYKGSVIKKAVLARKKDWNSKINVFDVEVAVLNHDENFKPGMSASCEVVIGRFPEVVTVPLESVFESEGATFVYLANKDRRDVTVGRRSDTEVEVLTGLTGGEKICLVDPTVKQELPGDKATEPELNKGRGAGRAAGGSGS